MILSNLIWSNVIITQDTTETKLDFASISIESCGLSINKKKYSTVNIKKYDSCSEISLQNPTNNFTFAKPKVIKLTSKELIIKAYIISMNDQGLVLNPLTISAKF